jgi:hypothetical protein
VASASGNLAAAATLADLERVKGEILAAVGFKLDEMKAAILEGV